MAGIYLHIPFCRKACHYCNFHFSTSQALQGGLVSALMQEISMRAPLSEPAKAYHGGETIDTIYFGGGTPSLLSNGQLKDIMRMLRTHYTIATDAEISFEANPDDISAARLAEWKEAGINRLSIGIQSFYDDDLLFMNRAHNAGQALQCLAEAKAAGFTNLSIDLIYGVPGMTNEKWARNIDIAIQAGIPHVSCYALTVEPSTAMDHMIKKKTIPDLDPELQASQFLYLSTRLEAAGYEHYEISNFSKPGMRSRHNTSYWQGKTYVGLGPSAHSFNGSSRQWNLSNNALYIKSIEKGELPREIEVLSVDQQINEYIMTALRTIEGINLKTLSERFGEAEVQRVLVLSGRYIEDGRMSLVSNHLVLSREGRLFADGIASELFR